MLRKRELQCSSYFRDVDGEGGVEGVQGKVKVGRRGCGGIGSGTQPGEKYRTGGRLQNRSTHVYHQIHSGSIN